MALSKPNRKVDRENRKFQSEWTEKYLFTVPTMASKRGTNRPVCLLCNESVAVAKEYNVKRHFTTKHSFFSMCVCFCKELLGLIPLEGHTTGEVLFQMSHFSGVLFFSEHKLDLQKVCLLITDGAPVMLGRVQGLAARLSAVAPQMQFLHCIIHESVLCTKLCGELKNTMDKVTSITSAEHADLLAYCDVRWLSKGKVLDCFCDLRSEIISFLRTCKHKRVAHFLEHMLDEQFMTQVHFLCDIFEHLNSLNSELQGREKFIADLVERLCAFKTKLNVFVSDITTNKLMHFTHLRTFLSSTPGAQVMPTMIEFMTKLTENFSDRFQGFSLPMEVMQFTRYPFSINHDSNFIAEVKEPMPNIDESALQLEMIDIQSSLALKLHLQSEGPINFWCNHISQTKYPTIKKVSVLILTMFGSTYTCESSFSHMNVIKIKARCCLSNEKLSQRLRIALTTYEPDYVKKSKSCVYVSVFAVLHFVVGLINKYKLNVLK
uniref:SPIN-DOC-like zinc-finger domain-containing protein n=1 Tax=Cyprinus carpio TaxID=7962 RepID=A0A8C1P8F6_CYPCA